MLPHYPLKDLASFFQLRKHKFRSFSNHKHVKTCQSKLASVQCFQITRSQLPLSFSNGSHSEKARKFQKMPTHMNGKKCLEIEGREGGQMIF